MKTLLNNLTNLIDSAFDACRSLLRVDRYETSMIHTMTLSIAAASGVCSATV